MAAHYLIDVLDPEQMAKEWNELPSRADEIKKRFAAMAKYFTTIESDFSKLETRVEQWNKSEKENKSNDKSRGRIISLGTERKENKPASDESKKEPDNEPVIKALDELSASYLTDYITEAMKYIAVVRKGFIVHRASVSDSIDDMFQEKRHKASAELYGVLSTFKRDWNNAERLEYFRKGRELFIQALESFSKVLDAEQHVNDVTYNAFVPRMEQFESINTMMGGLYSATDKYMRQFIANPEKFEESEIENLLGTLVKLVNLLGGYRWHVQELNAVMLNILHYQARELNLLSRLHTAHALALEHILKDKER